MWECIALNLKVRVRFKLLTVVFVDNIVTKMQFILSGGCKLLASI